MEPYPVFTKTYILLEILIVLLDGWECQSISGNVLRHIGAVRFNKSKVRFQRQSDEDRNYPTEETFFKEEYSPLECDENYHIADLGYVYFNFGRGEDECEYDFYGSKKTNCTVGVYCTGIISLKPKSKLTKRCEDEYLILSDTTDGEMSGCGEFSFNKIPRYPRNGGVNLYVSIKGGADSTKCIAMCMEDLKRGTFDLKPPLTLAAPGTSVNQDSQWLPPQCKCGVRRNNGRIVGGEVAFKNEFPWIAALVHPGTRKPFCGGSLINSRYVLTAAQCFPQNVSANQVEVLLHSHVLDRNPLGNWSESSLINVPGWNLPHETDESENSTRVKVVEILVHPKFDLANSYYYDYALLKLAETVDLFDSNVAPVCLPKQKLSYEDDKTMMTVAGWGTAWEDAPATSRLLLKLDVRYVSNRLCVLYTDPSDTHLCAGYLEGGKDRCQGDTGGPLIYLADSDTNQYVLSGLVSSGKGCARESELGLYSDVKKIIKWINDTASEGTWCAQ